MGYRKTVSSVAHHSMQRVVEEVMSLPGYAEYGEVISIATSLCNCGFKSNFFIQWVITDARHDSSANAFHTTVPCMSGRYATVY